MFKTMEKRNERIEVGPEFTGRPTDVAAFAGLDWDELERELVSIKLEADTMVIEIVVVRAFPTLKNPEKTTTEAIRIGVGQCLVFDGDIKVMRKSDIDARYEDVFTLQTFNDAESFLEAGNWPAYSHACDALRYMKGPQGSPALARKLTVGGDGSYRLDDVPRENLRDGNLAVDGPVDSMTLATIYEAQKLIDKGRVGFVSDE